MSQAQFGLCNVVVGWALIPEQENPLNTHKANDPPVLYLKKHPYSVLLFSHPNSDIYLSCALIAHPVLSSARFLILNSFLSLSLSLPATEGNKILLLWKLLTDRRTAASSVETVAYIWALPVCGLRDRFSLL